MSLLPSSRAARAESLGQPVDGAQPGGWRLFGVVAFIELSWQGVAGTTERLRSLFAAGEDRRGLPLCGLAFLLALGLDILFVPAHGPADGLAGPVYFDPGVFRFLRQQELLVVSVQAALFRNTGALDKERASVLQTRAHIACMPGLHMAHELEAARASRGRRSSSRSDLPPSPASACWCWGGIPRRISSPARPWRCWPSWSPAGNPSGSRRGSAPHNGESLRSTNRHDTIELAVSNEPWPQSSAGRRDA